jgi:hypothetical protein
MSTIKVSNILKLVGVRGLTFKDQTWYPFPFGIVGNPWASK